MALRIRLALWYSALFAVILVAFSLLTYALHVRGHYEERDRALLASAAHAAADLHFTTDRPLHLGAGLGELEIDLQLYDATGRMREDTHPEVAAPQIEPRTVLAAPAGPAYDAIAGLAPAMSPPHALLDGAFGLTDDATGRWRVFVLPIPTNEAAQGYVVVLSPLVQLDATMRLFRSTLLGLAVVWLLVALGSSYVIAGHALRPVDRMVQTAQTISQERDLSRRVPIPPHHDELGRLAETLNTMLASLETVARVQQRFVADASHELRAPLTAIQGNLELLRMHALPAVECAEVLAEVEREAVRLGRLVADLLALARADSGITLARRPVDLDRVLLDTLCAAQPLAHGQTLAVEPFEPAQTLGDADRLRQLLLILLDNALKYTPSDGSVTLGLRRDAAQAEITVQDTGVGISAADLVHVFERFYRADPARGRDPGGTGLGLSIARWIVEQHGGTLTLTSEPGAGTLATVRLLLAT